MTACLTAFRHVYEALTALCVVACVLALANGQPWWSWLFAALAVVSHEVSEP